MNTRAFLTFPCDPASAKLLSCRVTRLQFFCCTLCLLPPVILWSFCCTALLTSPFLFYHQTLLSYLLAIPRHSSVYHSLVVLLVLINSALFFLTIIINIICLNSFACTCGHFILYTPYTRNKNHLPERLPSNLHIQTVKSTQLSQLDRTL